jgi:hypothetical protein
MKFKRLPLLCLLLILQASFVIAKDNTPSFSIANTLQSNMVIQQGKPLHVWGKAATGAEIMVKADWNAITFKTKLLRKESGVSIFLYPMQYQGNLKRIKFQLDKAGRLESSTIF